MTKMKTSPDIRFYDTCSLLLKANNLFEGGEPFVISSITLEELENIKTSNNRDADIKYAARKLLHSLDENSGKYFIHIFTESMLNPIKEKDLSITNDMKILATAIDYNNTIRTDEVIFVTNDLALKTIANLFFGDGMIESVDEEDDDYTGYIETIFANDKAMELFYSHYKANDPLHAPGNSYINQYLIIKDKESGEVLDRLVRTEGAYRNVSYEVFDSKQFGRIKPLDVYQQLAADSFTHNKITLIKGPAGSGKSLLALGFLFNQLEKNKIDKIIVFCNTVAAKNAAKLG